MFTVKFNLTNKFEAAGPSIEIVTNNVNQVKNLTSSM